MKENFPADNSIALCDASSDCAHDVKTGSIVSSASTTKLKPCPFCGSTETMDMQYDGDFWVQCAGCNCSTQVFDSEAESHKAWDTRAQPSDGALTNEGFVLAKQCAVDVPGSERKELGYLLFDRIGVFRTREEVHAAIAELGLPLGWVSMTVEQLLPGYRMPPKICTCPSGDGSLRWPCPVHPPEVKALVLPERKGMDLHYDSIMPPYSMGWNACLDRVKELNL